MFGPYEYIKENRARMLKHFAELEAKEAAAIAAAAAAAAADDSNSDVDESKTAVSNENIEPTVNVSNTQSKVDSSIHQPTSLTSTLNDDFGYQTLPLDFSIKPKPMVQSDLSKPDDDDIGKAFLQSQENRLTNLEPDKQSELEFIYEDIGLKNPRFISPLASDLNPEDPLKCPECGKKFASNLLKKHRETHLNEKRILCILCSRQYASKKTFKAHLKTHKDES